MGKSVKTVIGVSVVAVLLFVIGMTAIACTTEGQNELLLNEVHKNAYYISLTDEEKQEFDNKLEAIFEHDDYKNLSDDEKE